ncbi:TVP38/TMEM64 family protein [Parenemella sanctibonifatiensis]|nr:TVP38/TMEM64 family protein [Parenemella sanctibonifatiensis]
MTSQPDHEKHGLPWGGLLRGVALVAFVSLMLWLAINVRLPPWEEIEARILGLGPWGWLAFIGLYAVVAITPIPVTIMALAGGAMFGVISGTLASMVGAMIGCWIAYLIARGLGRETVGRLLGSHRGRVEERLSTGGFLAVAALRLTPGIPYWPVNYGAGAFGINNRDFLTATAVAALPGQLSLVAIGAFLVDPSIINGVVVVLAWALVLVLTVMAVRRWRRDRAAATEHADPAAT